MERMGWLVKRQCQENPTAPVRTVALAARHCLLLLSRQLQSDCNQINYSETALASHNLLPLNQALPKSAFPPIGLVVILRVLANGGAAKLYPFAPAGLLTCKQKATT